MENSFNNIEHENVDEKYSSFCSSCNSVLQSICSIGIPSFYELSSENNLISKIEKNKDITKHIGTINVNELDDRTKEKTFVKNTDTSTKNLMKHHTYEKQEINKNGDDKIGCSITKKFKYIESLRTVNINSFKIIFVKLPKFKNNLNNKIISNKVISIN